MSKRMLLGVAMLLCAAASWAGQVTVSEAWVTETVPGQDTAAVSLRITSQQDGRLVKVSTPAAAGAEIHTMSHENGMMIMRATDALPLVAKQEYEIGTGNHIMLVGLKRPLKAGEKVPLTLTFEFGGKKKETVAVKAEVRPLGTQHEMHDMGDMHHHH